MKLKIVTTIITLIEYLIILSIFILFYLNQPLKVDRIIFIPNGSLNYTIKRLQNNNIDVTKIDKYFLYFIGKPQSGWIDLKDTYMTKLDFLYKITISKAALVPITIIPGETPYFVYKLISKKLNLNNKKLSNICDNSDYQFIFPNTYFLPKGMSEKKVCHYLISKSLKKAKSISYRIFNNFNRKKYLNYLIIASIIQKEAANKKEMPIISSVIYNRIKKGMKLQMDGSLNYGIYSHTKVTHFRIKSDNSKFNTYKFQGLPDKIVCFPNQVALLSAIFPKKTNYLFFVKVGKKHKFAVTYKEHLKNVKN